MQIIEVYVNDDMVEETLKKLKEYKERKMINVDTIQVGDEYIDEDWEYD